jgi:hypothetical protein
MAGSKPSAKLAIKSVDGGERTYIAAAWRRDDGRMGGMKLDRKVKQLAVQMEDGTIHRVKVGPDGKASHFIDLFLEDEAPSGARPSTRQAEPPPFDDGGGFGDDLPF